LGKVVSTKLKSIKNAQPKVCCDYIFSVFLKVFLGSPVFQKEKTPAVREETAEAVSLTT